MNGQGHFYFLNPGKYGARLINDTNGNGVWDTGNYAEKRQPEMVYYYPYDGMEGSYYSVFVETDLNKASTIDGQRLSSEDAIAEYIASMLLLETDPVFYISYDGVYTTGGTDYYEFRCHR